MKKKFEEVRQKIHKVKKIRTIERKTDLTGKNRVQLSHGRARNKKYPIVVIITCPTIAWARSAYDVLYQIIFVLILNIVTLLFRINMYNRVPFFPSSACRALAPVEHPEQLPGIMSL